MNYKFIFALILNLFIILGMVIAGLPDKDLIVTEEIENSNITITNCGDNSLCTPQKIIITNSPVIIKQQIITNKKEIVNSDSSQIKSKESVNEIKDSTNKEIKELPKKPEGIFQNIFSWIMGLFK